MDLFPQSPMTMAIEAIHKGTAIYTAVPEINALLDDIGWPTGNDCLLDPGCGNGGFLIQALGKLDLPLNDIEQATNRVHGYEFHHGACLEARTHIAAHLESRGWHHAAALKTAEIIVEERDFLLTPVPIGKWDIIAANPPYWRYANLSPDYRFEYDVAIPAHAKADLLYAYLNKSADIVKKGGKIGLITADRWLLNQGSAKLREKIGQRFFIEKIRRLESASAFYRPKTRRQGTPARVHPVSIILSNDEQGQKLTADIFPVDPMPKVDGQKLSEICEIRLAPWLGPDGIFIVDDKKGLGGKCLVPCYEPSDVSTTEDKLGPATKWAILTGEDKPPASILKHLDAQLDRMPKRGRKAVRWLPPETFHGRFPLNHDAVLIPRIAKKLRAIPLPAGTMPVNHNLVAVSGMNNDDLISILNDSRVQEQANAIALRLEGGYRSYTATLMRQIKVPYDLLTNLKDIS